MASQNFITGTISELQAAKMMMERLGWEVSKPLNPEVYDYLCRDPVNDKIYKIQVKTLRIRKERYTSYVVIATRGNGKPYQPEEIDYFIAVNKDKTFMFECTGLTEYWCSPKTVKKRWTELTA